MLTVPVLMADLEIWGGMIAASVQMTSAAEAAACSEPPQLASHACEGHALWGLWRRPCCSQVAATATQTDPGCMAADTCWAHQPHVETGCQSVTGLHPVSADLLAEEAASDVLMAGGLALDCRWAAQIHVSSQRHGDARS